MRLNKFQINDGKGDNQREKKSVTNASKGIVQAIRKVTDWLRGTFKRVSFETNDDYRRFFLASDISQARIVISLLAVTIALFAIGDYMFFGFSLTFYVLAALRLGLIVCSIAQVRYIGRVKNYRSYDVSTLTYLLVVVIEVVG